MIEEFTVSRGLLEKIIGYLQTQPWIQVNGIMAEIKATVDKTEQAYRIAAANGKDEKNIEARQ